MNHCSSMSTRETVPVDKPWMSLESASFTAPRKDQRFDGESTIDGREEKTKHLVRKKLVEGHIFSVLESDKQVC